MAEAVALMRAWVLRLEEAAESTRALELLSAAAVASMQESVPRLAVAVVSARAPALAWAVEPALMWVLASGSAAERVVA